MTGCRWRAGSTAARPVRLLLLSRLGSAPHLRHGPQPLFGAIGGGGEGVVGGAGSISTRETSHKKENTVHRSKTFDSYKERLCAPYLDAPLRGCGCFACASGVLHRRRNSGAADATPDPAHSHITHRLD